MLSFVAYTGNEVNDYCKKKKKYPITRVIFCSARINRQRSHFIWNKLISSLENWTIGIKKVSVKLYTFVFNVVTVLTHRLKRLYNVVPEPNRSVQFQNVGWLVEH